MLDDHTANLLGVHSSDRVEITYRAKSLVAIVNIAGSFPEDTVGFYEEISRELGAKDGETVNVRLAEPPESLHCIRAKIRNERLRENEINL
jgi:hypothetical protein